MEGFDQGVSGVGDAFEIVGRDRTEIPGAVVTYLRASTQIAALLPTPSFLQDLEVCRRKISSFAWTLDAEPRETLRAALVAAELDVSAWWDSARAVQQAPNSAVG